MIGVNYRNSWSEKLRQFTLFIFCIAFVIIIDTYYNICYDKGEKMKSYSSKDIIKALIDDGWYEVNSVGSHHQFKHPNKKGRVTVPHPRKDLTRKTIDNIEKQSGLFFR